MLDRGPSAWYNHSMSTIDKLLIINLVAVFLTALCVQNAIEADMRGSRVLHLALAVWWSSVVVSSGGIAFLVLVFPAL